MCAGHVHSGIKLFTTWNHPRGAMYLGFRNVASGFDHVHQKSRSLPHMKRRLMFERGKRLEKKVEGSGVVCRPTVCTQSDALRAGRSRVLRRFRGSASRLSLHANRGSPRRPASAQKAFQVARLGRRPPGAGAPAWPGLTVLRPRRRQPD